MRVQCGFCLVPAYALKCLRKTAGPEESGNEISEEKRVKVTVLSPLGKTRDSTTSSNNVPHPASFPDDRKHTHCAVNYI